MSKKPVKAATRHARAKRAWITAQGGYEAQLAAQGGGCAICGHMPKPGQRRLSIDHNHKTGEGRGLLCGNCNRGLPWFKDSYRHLYTAAYYIESGWQAAVWMRGLQQGR
jgi:hypothetical protein